MPAMHTSAMPNAGNALAGSRPYRAAASRKFRNTSASTGSAPDSRTSTFDRSSGSSARRSARAPSAYEKLGPAVTVPPNSDSQRNHRSGRARKSWGAPWTSEQPPVIGTHSSPISPMSWYSGSHDTTVSSGVIDAAAQAPSRLWQMLRCRSITPFGSDVEPDVNCRSASASGSSAGRCQSSAPTPSSPHRTSSSTNGGPPGSGATRAASSGSTSTSRESDCASRCRVWATNRSSDAIRMGSGSVTRTAPASHTPWTAATRLRVVGPSSATWSPGTTPSACSRAATVRAWAWSVSQPTVWCSSPVTNVTVPRSAAATCSIRATSERADGGAGLTAPSSPVSADGR